MNFMISECMILSWIQYSNRVLFQRFVGNGFYKEKQNYYFLKLIKLYTNMDIKIIFIFNNLRWKGIYKGIFLL